MDALPIQTTSHADYASTVAGVNHACGHDAHSAMVYGAMAILRSVAEQSDVPIVVRAIFQPAEETSEGALQMMQFGALEGVERLFALHVDPALPVGHAATRAGVLTAGCDTFEVEFMGEPGHSARPYLARDALAAAVNWIQQVYAQVPRSVDSREAVVVSVGTLHAGNAANVVPGTAVASGTIRTLRNEARAEVLKRMRELAAAVESMTHVHIAMRVTTHTPSLVNDPATTQAAMMAARAILRDERVRLLDLPSMGAEDFAFYSQHVPACLLRLGTAGPEAQHSPRPITLHCPDFDIDERALIHGAKILALSTLAHLLPAD